MNLEADLENDNLSCPELQLELDIQCKYFEIDEFYESIKNLRERFSVLSLNIRSFPNKIDQFQDMLHEISNENFYFSTICLQELWSIPDNVKVSLDGYHDLESVLRGGGRRGGGVGIFVHSNYKYDIIHELSKIEDGHESIFVKVFINQNQYKVIGSIYRPPSGNIQNFNDWINDLLANFETNSEFKNAEEIILSGDFNINLLNHKDHIPTNEFFNSLISSSFLPAISLPSRINENSSTLIDNIFSNKWKSHQKGGLLLSSISDHLPILYVDTIISQRNEKKVDYFRNLKVSLLPWTA